MTRDSSKHPFAFLPDLVKIEHALVIYLSGFAMANPLLDGLDLDDVLVKFKVYDRYHAATITLLTVGLMFEYMWYCNHVMVAQKVEYRCIKYNNGSTDIYTAKCINPDLCLEWMYDNPESLVAEFQLACQDWKRITIGSVHMLGYMVGVFTVGSLSDRFGRKILVIITCVTGGILGCAKSFATSYWLYVALEFFEAAMGDPISPIFTLAIEMVATKSRVTYTTICMMGVGLGGIFFALVAWLIPYWRTLLRVVYAPGLLAIFFIYLLDESPRWLLTNKKKNAAVKILRKAAKLNKLEIEENLNTLAYAEDKAPSLSTVIKNTFKSASLLKRFIVCAVWWIAVSFVNFGLIINSMSLGGNNYLNFGFTSVTKTLGTLVTRYFINKFNRRSPLIFSFVLCALLCTGQPFLPKNIFWLQITNYMIGLLFSCACFFIIYVFTSELFPTQSRNSMHSLCSSVGRLGTIIATQSPLLMTYWSGLPSVVFGVVFLFAGLVTLLVPDTADRSLPDTVCQAEKMEIKLMAEGHTFKN